MLFSNHLGITGHRYKEITQWGWLFSEYIAGLGYDGLIAMEGGEGHGFNHDSYVIFDASKARLVREQKINPKA